MTEILQVTLCWCARKNRQTVSTLFPYLVQREGAHAEGGQFNGVQQGHLGHAVGLCAAAGPVLVTLDLKTKRMQTGRG